MAVAAWIDHDARSVAARILNPDDQFAFVIALAELDRQAQLAAMASARLFDIGERIGPVDFGFARAEQIEVRTVEHQYDGALPASSLASLPTHASPYSMGGFGRNAARFTLWTRPTFSAIPRGARPATGPRSR